MRLSTERGERREGKGSLARRHVRSDKKLSRSTLAVGSRLYSVFEALGGGYVSRKRQGGSSSFSLGLGEGNGSRSSLCPREGTTVLGVRSKTEDVQ